MAHDIKPCPFCGQRAVLDTNGHQTWVICVRCGSTGKRFNNGRDAADKAVEAWNMREESE